MAMDLVLADAIHCKLILIPSESHYPWVFYVFSHLITWPQVSHYCCSWRWLTYWHPRAYHRTRRHATQQGSKLSSRIYVYTAAMAWAPARPSCFALNDVIFFFRSARNLWGFWTDRPLPRDRKLAYFQNKPRSQNLDGGKRPKLGAISDNLKLCIANISGTVQNIDNRKTALSTSFQLSPSLTTTFG